jgi:hypothetical protein
MLNHFVLSEESLAALLLKLADLILHLLHGRVDYVLHVVENGVGLVITELGLELLQVCDLSLLCIKLVALVCDLNELLFELVQTQVCAGNAVLPVQFTRLHGLLAPGSNRSEHLRSSEMVQHILAPLVFLFLAVSIHLKRFEDLTLPLLPEQLHKGNLHIALSLVRFRNGGSKVLLHDGHLLVGEPHEISNLVQPVVDLVANRVVLDRLVVPHFIEAFSDKLATDSQFRLLLRIVIVSANELAYFFETGP